jgi:hypothetical protein
VFDVRRLIVTFGEGNMRSLLRQTWTPRSQHAIVARPVSPSVLEETPNAPTPDSLDARLNTSAEASDKDTESSMALRLARWLKINKIFPERATNNAEYRIFV